MSEDVIDFGHSIADVLSHRGEEDDYILAGAVCELLTEKENQHGFDALCEQEKIFYIAGDMIRQLDSGGFGSYFYNTGHLAHRLIDALTAIGSTTCLALAKQAISIYGKVPATNYDDMLEELDKLTEGFDLDLLGEQDDQYFDSDEHLGTLLMNYADKHQQHFQLT